MSNEFVWTPTYSVQVSSMDAQHKRLFEIVHELYAAMSVGEGKGAAGHVLQELIEYTVHHFAEEEKLMEQANYPTLVLHRAEHRALTDKVLAFKKDFDAGRAGITPALMTFLQHWLTTHIQNVDQKYGKFLNAHGIH